MSATTLDAIVVGGGMVGATAASLLSRAGERVALVETRAPDAFDAEHDVGLRVSALSPGSAAVLAEAGAWRRIERERHAPYRRMQVEDRDGDAVLAFDAPASGLERLGTIVENDLVQWALWQALADDGRVQLHCPAHLQSVQLGADGVDLSLEDGTRLRARLLIGCDGGASQVREQAGIASEHWEYNQRGLVAVLSTERPNRGVAWQRFMAGGPLAMLPLADGRHSIVWTRPTAEAERLLGLGDDDFLAELVAASGQPFGRFTGCGPRGAFPLTMRLAERYVAGRAVLLGDAAHVVHPLAGQGVNLGLLDAAGLVECLLDARGSGGDQSLGRALQRFDRWRRSESEAVARGIHALRGAFEPDLLAPLRQAGIRLLGRSTLLREPFLRRAAGLHRGAPRLARGARLVDLVAGR